MFLKPLLDLLTEIPEEFDDTAPAFAKFESSSPTAFPTRSRPVQCWCHHYQFAKNKNSGDMVERKRARGRPRRRDQLEKERSASQTKHLKFLKWKRRTLRRR